MTDTDTDTHTPGTFSIMDLEWTSWEGARSRQWSGPGEFREVIQIGLITVIDDDQMRELGSFEIYVKPIINPVLSDYVMDLTGIRQSDVDNNGVTLSKAQEQLREFLGKSDFPIYSHGNDGQYMRENCERIGTPFVFPPERFVNLNEPIADFMGRPKDSYSSCDLPELMGFPPPGDAHTAVADCRCIAEALKILRAAGSF